MYENTLLTITIASLQTFIRPLQYNIRGWSQHTGRAGTTINQIGIFCPTFKKKTQWSRLSWVIRLVVPGHVMTSWQVLIGRSLFQFPSWQDIWHVWGCPATHHSMTHVSSGGWNKIKHHKGKNTDIHWIYVWRHQFTISSLHLWQTELFYSP